MEYERALFRVYDRSMEGSRAPYVRNACHLAQQSLLIVSASLLVCLVLLHRDFVNKPGTVQAEMFMWVACSARFSSCYCFKCPNTDNSVSVPVQIIGTQVSQYSRTRTTTLSSIH